MAEPFKMSEKDLMELIAKTNRPGLAATVQGEMSAYKESKASMVSAIKPAVMNNAILTEVKKTNSLLKRLITVNQVGIDNNKEIAERMFSALEYLSTTAGERQRDTAAAGRETGPRIEPANTENKPSEGGGIGSFLNSLFGAAAPGLLASFLPSILKTGLKVGLVTALASLVYSRLGDDLKKTLAEWGLDQDTVPIAASAATLLFSFIPPRYLIKGALIGSLAGWVYGKLNDYLGGDLEKALGLGPEEVGAIVGAGSLVVDLAVKLVRASRGLATRTIAAEVAAATEASVAAGAGSGTLAAALGVAAATLAAAAGFYFASTVSANAGEEEILKQRRREAHVRNIEGESTGQIEQSQRAQMVETAIYDNSGKNIVGSTLGMSDYEKFKARKNYNRPGDKAYSEQELRAMFDAEQQTKSQTDEAAAEAEMQNRLISPEGGQQSIYDNGGGPVLPFNITPMDYGASESPLAVDLLPKTGNDYVDNQMKPLRDKIKNLKQMGNEKNLSLIEDRARKEGGSSAPIVINKGGDTVNNINNTTGGNSGGAGSPSKDVNPWDMFTIGSPYSGAYF